MKDDVKTFSDNFPCSDATSVVKIVVKRYSKSSNIQTNLLEPL